VVRRLSLHGPRPAHREDLHQAIWGLVMGACFAFVPAIVATLIVGIRYGKDAGLATYAAITVLGAVVMAWRSARRAAQE
jgi:hypothetical protein